MTTAVRCLIVAKAPVSGRVKTRLGATVGMDRAAELAAAALRDTIVAATAGFGAGWCVAAIDGDLAAAVRGRELTEALSGWRVVPQCGVGLAARLSNAFAAAGPGPVLQLGMDTPQVTAEQLGGLAHQLSHYDAVVAPARDGGWWALALRDPARAEALLDVAMSQPRTCADTLAALATRGLRVGIGPTLSDVDTADDAVRVAADCQGSHFARAWGEAWAEVEGVLA